MARVTVILPNFNHAAYLPQRIESVLQQSFGDFEIILLDDASTDHSKDVLARYAEHPKVKQLILNTANSGNTFIQWEKGLQQATGEYIWIAESDDWADPDLLQTLVATLDQHPEAALAFCASEWVDEHNNAIPRTCTRQWKHDFVMNGKAFAEEYLLGYNHICNASAVVFRRNEAVVLPAVKACQAYRASGDRLFWICLATGGNTSDSATVCYVAKKLNHFRQHQVKVSGAAASRGQNIIEDHTIVGWSLAGCSRQSNSAMRIGWWQRRCICGYHYHAIMAGNVSEEGRKKALQVWQQEKEFGRLSHLVYLINQALKRIV